MLIQGNCKDIIKEHKDNSIDLIVTDPPYGISFMGKDWDKALSDKEVWQQCYRVLKEGKLAFVMCSPRQDVLSRMIISLEDAGFRTNYTSIYWTYASGFPKAANVSKLIDKRGGANLDKFSKLIKKRREELGLSMKDVAKHFPSASGGITGCVWNWENGSNVPTVEEYNKLVEVLKLEGYPELKEAEREIISREPMTIGIGGASKRYGKEKIVSLSATDEAKKMEGAYVGFQPKPAVEVILVVSKGKTLTWLDDCRIPYQSEQDIPATRERTGLIFDPAKGWNNHHMVRTEIANEKGRFPANLLVSDDVLNDGKNYKSGKIEPHHNIPFYSSVGSNEGWKRQSHENHKCNTKSYNDSGSYSRYFSLDAWKIFPFIITPKASKSERNSGLQDREPIKVNDGRQTPIDNPFQRGETLRTNTHPTVKPLKLFSYLITMGSREGDTVLDPFVGSGTTYIAATQLHRKPIGIEINPDYIEIAKARVKPYLTQTKFV